jgi:ADP-ribose pyrophosphatase
VSDRLLLETPFLRCVDRDGWIFVDRPRVRGVVVMVALTDDGKLLLVEQHRPAIGGPVIELPAGLVGDDPAHADEELAAAANRELREETGYDARRIVPMAICPPSPGMSSEMASFFAATGLRKVGAGGGVGDERIDVHEVTLGDAPEWLRARAAAGVPVAATVYAGLFLLQASRDR